MKNYLLLFALLLFVGCNKEKKKEAPIEPAPIPAAPATPLKASLKNVTIEVMLISEVPKGVTDLKDYIQLYSTGESVGSIIGKPNEFTTIVYGGKKVKWKGRKFNTIKKPKIKLIMKEKGGDFLDWKGSDKPNSDDEIELNVKNKDAVNDKTDIKYSIAIEINGILDTIDPVLKLHDN